MVTRRKFHDVRHFVCSQLRACTQTPLAAFCRAAPPGYEAHYICNEIARLLTVFQHGLHTGGVCPVGCVTGVCVPGGVCPGGGYPGVLWQTPPCEQNDRQV